MTDSMTKMVCPNFVINVCGITSTAMVKFFSRKMIISGKNHSRRGEIAEKHHIVRDAVELKLET